MMIIPLRCTKVTCGRAWPLPPGLHILHAYSMLEGGNQNVSIVVRNLSNTLILLKKGMCLALVVSATLMPQPDLPQGEDGDAVSSETPREPMSIQE